MISLTVTLFFSENFLLNKFPTHLIDVKNVILEQVKPYLYGISNSGIKKLLFLMSKKLSSLMFLPFNYLSQNYTIFFGNILLNISGKITLFSQAKRLGVLSRLKNFLKKNTGVYSL